MGQVWDILITVQLSLDEVESLFDEVEPPQTRPNRLYRTLCSSSASRRSGTGSVGSLFDYIGTMLDNITSMSINNDSTVIKAVVNAVKAGVTLNVFTPAVAEAAPDAGVFEMTLTKFMTNLPIRPQT